MKTTKQLLGAVSAFALVAMSSAPALAQGTSAGTTITNNVSVSYEVGGVVQNPTVASDTFTVDRRVNVTVTSLGNTSVSPGQQNAVLAFDVTNLSNGAVDFALEAALESGTATNIDNFQIYRDDGNNVFDANDTLVTFLDEVAEDETVRVYVIADIGLDAANADEFDVSLTADAHAAGGAGLGAELVSTTGANTAGIDTVLFDGAGAVDGPNDGAFSAIGTYEVEAAVLTVTKTSRVVSDPFNGTNNPKAIPGATIEYCVTVANAATAQASATDVEVVDNLPADVTFINGSIFVNGDANCANGTAGGSFTTGTGPAGEDQVSGALPDVAAGGTRSLYFRVEID